MINRRRLFVRLGLLAIVVVFGLGPARAQHGAPAGPSQPVEPETYLANVKQVTFEGQRAGEGYFSADGKEIIYQAVMPGCPHYQIYTRSLAGGEPKMVSVGKGMTTCANFHPTNGSILFAATHLDPDTFGPPPENAGRYAWNRHKSFEIFVANRDGSGLQRLTEAPGYDAEAAFSADGGRIVFTSDRDGAPEIYTMKVDGTDVRRITNAKGYDGGPFFSPDGTKICWRGFRDLRPGFERYAQVFVAEANGLRERQMTFNTAVNWAPYFHPDGKHLAYCTNIGGPSNFELVLMRLADAKVVRLTFTNGTDIMPVFSPDGKKIMWTTSRFGNGSHLAIADFTMPPASAFGDPYRDEIAAAGDHAQGGAQAQGNPHAQKPAEAKPAEAGRPAAHAAATTFVAAPISKKLERVAVPAPVDKSGGETAADITAAGAMAHVRMLSADEMEGRRSGKKGCEMAASYIEADLKRAGLKPGTADGYRFDFDIHAGCELGEGNALRLTAGAAPNPKVVNLAVSTAWTPLPFTANTAATGELVFVGYGVTTADKSWDDYAGIDAKGKIVLAFLRGTPENAPAAADPHGGGMQLYQDARYKAFNAKQHGAAGIVFVADARQRDNDSLEDLNSESSPSRSDLPIAQARRSALIDAFKVAGLDFLALETKCRESSAPTSTALGLSVHLSTAVTALLAGTSNVVAKLEGADPQLKEEWIVIGAHYDHLGHGGHGSLAQGGGVGEIHNGADDNASGVAGLLELAEYFVANPPKRSMVFMAYSGEEEGLLGSQSWVAAEKANLGRIAGMLNMDMIGRYGDEGIAIDGVDTCADWRKILEAANVGLKIGMTAGAMSGRSDHASFIGAGVPSLHFFTGAHADYHRPTDDWEKVNAKGLVDTIELVARTAKALDAMPAKPKFTAPKGKEQQATGGGYGAYLGTIPSYTQDTGGVRLQGASPGSPAEKAGLKKDDVLVKLGTFDIDDIYDFTNALRSLKPGEKIDVEFLRDGKRQKAEVTLARR